MKTTTPSDSEAAAAKTISFPPQDVSQLTPPPPAAKGGRPSLLTPALASAILCHVQTMGCSDTMAGALEMISPSTISRWKRENEEFALLLAQARAQFDVARLRHIGRASKRNGQLDWRAQVWLLQQSSPETYGPPSRRRTAKATEETRAEGALVITPEQLSDLQARRRVALEKMEGPVERAAAPHGDTASSKNVTNIAETSAQAPVCHEPPTVAAVYDRRGLGVGHAPGASHDFGGHRTPLQGVACDNIALGRDGVGAGDNELRSSQEETLNSSSFEPFSA